MGVSVSSAGQLTLSLSLVSRLVSHVSSQLIAKGRLNYAFDPDKATTFHAGLHYWTMHAGCAWLLNLRAST